MMTFNFPVPIFNSLCDFSFSSGRSTFTLPKLVLKSNLQSPSELLS